MYTKRGNHLAFFVPNIPFALAAAEVMKEIDFGGSTADHGELVCTRACEVVLCGVAVTGEVAGGSSVPPRVIFTKRPTPLSATSEAIVATVILPDATAVGKVVYKPVSTPVKFAVGDSMEISHVVGTGTPTGMGCYFFECIESNELPANNTDMILSA